MFRFDEFPTEVVRFEWLKMAVQQTIPRGVMLELATSDSFFADQMAMRLTAQILGQRDGEHWHTETVSFDFSVPANRWQDFKEKHEGAWFLRWAKPVEYVTWTETKTVRFHIEKAVGFPYQGMNFPPQLGEPVLIPMVKKEN